MLIYSKIIGAGIQRQGKGADVQQLNKGADVQQNNYRCWFQQLNIRCWFSATMMGADSAVKLYHSLKDSVDRL